MKLLLHCCCAPCSVSVVKNLHGENLKCDLFWYNPNIHLYNEYLLRRDCLVNFASSENLNLKMIDEYGLEEFLDAVYPLTGSRCEKCYSMRLGKTAAFAAKEGYKSFSTTLLISPYQKHEAIKNTGVLVAKKYGLEFIYRDFRPFFREGQSLARSKGFYMQKYCGCIFSEKERFLKQNKGAGNEHKPNI